MIVVLNSRLTSFTDTLISTPGLTLAETENFDEVRRLYSVYTPVINDNTESCKRS